MLRAGVLLVSVVACSALWVYVRLVRGERRWMPLSALALFTVLFAEGIAVPRFPAERLHFVEYGLLGMISLRASLRTTAGRWGASLGLAAAVICLIGALDEVIQYLLPNRVFEWQDIWLNIWGGLLGVGAYLVVVPPVRGS